MRKSIVLLAVCAFAFPAFAVPDFNPPTWRGRPNTTTQGWGFNFGATFSGELSDDSVVPTRNPNELPTNIIPGVPTPAAPNILYVQRQRAHVSESYLTLLGTEPAAEPARLLIGIPDFPSDSESMMRIQLVYRIATLPDLYIFHSNGLNEDRDIITNIVSFTDRSDPELTGWRQATIDLQFSRTAQWHGVLFTNSSGLELDIDSIVIDTIVPAPSAVALLGLGGLVAMRRRRA